MPPDTTYTKTAVDKAKGIRYGLKNGKWEIIGRIQPETTKPTWGEERATLFNQSATGASNLPELWKNINAFRYKFADDPLKAIADILSEQGENQINAVNKYNWKDPRKYEAAIPFIGPGLSEVSTGALQGEDITKSAARVGGMTAGASIMSKLPEVSSKIPEVLSRTGEAVKSGAGNVARGTVREFADRGKGSVDAAEAAAKKEAASKDAAFKSSAQQELARARGAHETEVSMTEREGKQKMAEAKGRHEQELADREKAIRERKAQHTKDVEAAKAKHGEKQETAETKLADSATKEASARLNNARLTEATKKLNGYRERVVKDTVQNIDKAEKAERSQLDARWEQFNKMIASEKGNLSKVGESVLKAEKEDIKGSKENIKVFRDVLGRLKEQMIEGTDGSIKFMDNQMIGLDQLRGYWKELGDQIYNKELPGDVRKALETVRTGVDEEIRRTILDRYGKQAGGEMLKRYDVLKEDWSGYKRTWDDLSSVNPLPRIKRMLRNPSVVQEGIPVTERIASILKGENAAAVRKLLESRTQYGADPRNITKLMAVAQKIKDLPKMFQSVPETKMPKFPGEFKPPEEPKMPDEPTEAKVSFPAPITEAKVSLPKPPENEPFSRSGYIREGIEKKVKSASNIGSGLGGFWALKDLLSGNPKAAGHIAEALALMLGARKVLMKPKVLDWLSKEGPTL